jgi:hypothetical protein
MRKLSRQAKIALTAAAAVTGLTGILVRPTSQKSSLPTQGFLGYFY